MDRARKLANIEQRLRNAAVAGDWQALALADRELAALLAKLAAIGTRTPSDVEALAQLREAHDDARARCLREFARLSESLAEIRARKGGWMAYALNGAGDEDRS